MSSRTDTDTRSGRRGRAASAQIEADAEAAATSIVIASLRKQLGRQDVLEHPAVTSELRKLEELLTAQLSASGRACGRHRVTTAAAPG